MTALSTDYKKQIKKLQKNLPKAKDLQKTAGQKVQAAKECLPNKKQLKALNKTIHKKLSKKKKPSKAPIVGGIFGGLAAVGLLVGLAVLLFKTTDKEDIVEALEEAEK